MLKCGGEMDAVRVKVSKQDVQSMVGIAQELVGIAGKSYIRDNQNGERSKKNLFDKFTGTVGEFAVNTYLLGYEDGQQEWLEKARNHIQRYKAGWGCGDGNYDINFNGFPIDVKASPLYTNQSLSGMHLYVSKNTGSFYEKIIQNSFYIQTFVHFNGSSYELKDNLDFLKNPWKRFTGEVTIAGWILGSELTQTHSNYGLKYETTVSELYGIEEFKDALDLISPNVTQTKIITGSKNI